MADETMAPPLPVSQAAPRLLTLRLSIMMFLQWGMFGMWAPLAGAFILAKTSEGGLGFSQYQLGWIMGISGSIGALAAPFIAGQIADRYFSTERLIAVLLLIGAALWWVMSSRTEFPAWLLLAIISSLALAPTGPLSNSLAFSHMTDSRRQFPVVRVWGTIGWIVTGWVFSWVWLQKTVFLSGDWPFLHVYSSGVLVSWKPPFFSGEKYVGVARMVDSLKAAAIVAVVYALYCLTLPNTPPKRQAHERLAWRKAFRLFRYRSFFVLMVAALLIACIHNIFFMQTPPLLRRLGVAEPDIAPAMSVGQITEIVMIAILGWLLKGLGMRAVLAIGGTAYLLRFVFLGSTWLSLPVIVASLGLHGVCFACYYAAAFIYVDRLAEADVRHSVQTVFGILVGIGPVLGGWLNGALADWATPPAQWEQASPFWRAVSSTGLTVQAGALNYTVFWYAVAAIGALAAIVLAVFFRDEAADKPVIPSGGAAATALEQEGELQELG